ncbi:hypothetical protein RN001_009205 [Aquatica leii]|uniref:Cytochrome c oxidase assembly factor 3 n=1 Tax=Aquatica leii TaxID=1421715 RepID=A0AAN7P492_9COLE|nr:hypothetical protein RN001_009205 [Aquatica leii]
MNSGERMPKIDPAKIKNVDLNFMKVIEQQNFDRVRRLQRLRRSNIITGSVLGVGILSIYAYTMLAVKQENFLDDFDEPLKVIDK